MIEIFSPVSEALTTVMDGNFAKSRDVISQNIWQSSPALTGLMTYIILTIKHKCNLLTSLPSRTDILLSGTCQVTNLFNIKVNNLLFNWAAKLSTRSTISTLIWQTASKLHDFFTVFVTSQLHCLCFQQQRFSSSGTSLNLLLG